MKISTHQFKRPFLFVRVATVDNTVWFPLKDIAKILKLGQLCKAQTDYLAHAEIAQIRFFGVGSSATAISLQAVYTLAQVANNDNGPRVVRWAYDVVTSLVGNHSQTIAPPKETPTKQQGNAMHCEEVTVANHKILVVTDKDGQVFFSPRSVCLSLGVDWPTQLEKIKADPALSTCMAVKPTWLPTKLKVIERVLLPLQHLTSWMLTVRAANPSLKDAINTFCTEGPQDIYDWMRTKNAKPAAPKEQQNPSSAEVTRLEKLVEHYKLREKLAVEETERFCVRVLAAEKENYLLKKEISTLKTDQAKRHSLEAENLQLQNLQLKKEILELKVAVVDADYKLKVVQLNSVQNTAAPSSVKTQ